MKKFYILLLALAIAAFAVPAMAGEVSMDGEYTLTGNSDSNSEDSTYFEHELDLNINVSEGDVMFHWDVELADTDMFDKTGTSFYGTTWQGGDIPKGIWDGFYVKWQATDQLAFKAGIYGVSDNQSLIFDSAGNQHGIMGLIYGLSDWEVAGYLAKEQDNAEDDVTDMFLTASGPLGPAAVSLVYGQRTNDVVDNSDGTGVYVDAEFGAGPVAVYIAYGQNSSDISTGDGGTAMILDLGLADLVGFELTATVIQTNEDWVSGSVFGNDYGYAKLLDCDEDADATYIGLAASYAYNDKLDLSLLAVVSSDVGGDDGPTEIDVQGDYSFADNVTYSAGYATVSGGDAGEATEDVSRLWHEINFAF